ncbi:peptidoglycan DD-metalloendopeptidase family protein [Klebsiella quasipneumoniae]|uniref:peptidoglycan DD-metalloendopeptidase family protein n=1 Tax=Klebsiella quasipneumoniae TaxID=1463165 RepID=UPI000C7A5A9A|nr:peptidoglycan DD-metalloendopeptidase family protein [Klebsiella quasipneumoniae]PLF12243.1 peptidase M23 [Klebsiella quasipneumoniae]
MEQYTVQKGDSLWKISRKFGIDINELASINGLHTKAERHIIQPGQILNLPSKDKVYDTQLTLRICDLAWRPLENAKVRLTFDGRTYEYITDGTGIVAGLLIEDSTKGIKVELQHLNKKEYILIANHKKLPLGTLSLRISSREMIIKGSTRVKQGTQQSSKQQEKEKAKQRNDSSASGPSEGRTTESPTPSVNQTTRTEGGAPTSVSNIGNVSEGLRLPPKAEQYRDYIIETAKKYDFQPEGLAALIYAESRWKANATNPTGSGAVGLGQFKPDTWLPLCAEPESKVYQFITEKYSYQKLFYKNGKLFGESVDGTVTEIDKDTVLSLRVNVEYSIDMIGLYDRQGLDNISGVLLGVLSLEPDEVAKLAYLIHHNGENGAYDIIMNGAGTENKYRVYTDKTLESRLKSNVNDEDVERYLSIDGKGRTAYVAWLISYYRAIIVPDDYRVIPKGTDYDLKEIIKKLNPNFDLNTELPAQTSTASTASTVGVDSMSGYSDKWHNPLDICKIRTHGLSGPRAASFGSNVRHVHGVPRPHQGVDIEALPGTPIYAVADGRVAMIRDNGDYGKQICIIIQIEDLPENKISLCQYDGNQLQDVYFFYAHLSEINSDISHDSSVKCGDVLGKTGCTGNADGMTTIELGAHLHFEARRIERPGRGIIDRIDPVPFIDGFNYP